MKNIWIVIAFFFLCSFEAGAAERGSNVLAYQGVLYDSGGNPLADGEVKVDFAILDVDGDVLFSEYQYVDVIDGNVSALVGNGTAPDGGNSGGVSNEIFLANGPIYLEVEAEGYPSTQQMEIASVPYAMVSDIAYSVASGAVNSEGIEDGSIKFEDFGDDALTGLVDELSGLGVLTQDNLDSMYREPSGAAKIGVERGLNFSGSNHLQGVLGDLDRAIKQREERISGVDGAIQSEVIARQQAINAEAQARQLADSNLQPMISDINNIPGILDESKIDQEITRDDELQQAFANFSQSQDVPLYPNTVWFDGGVKQHGENISLPAGFTKSSCRISIGLQKATVGSLDTIQTDCVWNGANTACEVDCIYNGAFSEIETDDNGNPDLASAVCTASYFVMCIKGM